MQRDYLDILWGGLLAAFGLVVAGYAALHYDIGSLRRMGPGFFPVSLGVILAILGGFIAVPAYWRKGDRRPFAWREMLGIVAALLLFAVLMNRIGLVATTAICALVASSVAPGKGIAWRLILALAVTLLTWAIFILALKMTIPVWPWSR
ncbi:tripartite tricarboxylate transporter TctB family protein [Tropicimonas sp. IMCC34043]|uniref:tripartite tricarboxylate transporter TctB family protein n=1 Tax=Tropicimonas sp. IMCC34043 TaxID=2248760 RepID=UPI000E251B97|nr:tripartite tricarboxylate transporter TctB family protein [Tropicimonas sp. IMCC34043]